MKKQIYNSSQLNVWLFVLSTLFLFSCSFNNWIVPSEYVGQWKTTNNKITVRFKHGNEHSQYISDSAILNIQINTDKTASGFIGLATFKNGKIRKNPSLPWEKGIKYIIECGSIGRIFNNDPLEAKEVEIWLGPLDENGKFYAELRYTEGMALFPMGWMLFEKVKN